MSSTKPSIKQVILVGHCGADSGTLSVVIGRASPNMAVLRVNDASSLDRAVTADTLLLVNRVLDGSFSDAGGIELIRRVRARAGAPAAILISNYADAQRDAEQAGALPGFGKSQAWDESTVQMLRRVLT